MGAKVMSLSDPTKKMSKSDENENGFISMSDATDVIIRKFKRAVTDSDNKVAFDPENKAGISNLMTIYGLFTGKSMEEVETEFDGKGYGDFKMAVGEAVASVLEPINAKRQDLLKNKDYLLSVMSDGREKASKIASRMLKKVYKKVGLILL
jgi:tryptophanyl-tRNA synthetase